MDDSIRDEQMRKRLFNVIVSISRNHHQQKPGMHEATAHVLDEIEGKEMELFGLVSEKKLKRRIMKMIKKEYLKRQKEQSE